jgi:hypothetical protein
MATGIVGMPYVSGRIGQHRVTNALKSFAASGIIPEPLSRGPRKKITKAILDLIDIRTLQDAHLSSSLLDGEISDRFRISITPRSVAFQRQMMGFHCQPPRHTQELNQRHIEARVEFCQKMLANPSWLPLIHFSDESRFVLGDDKRWSRREERIGDAHNWKVPSVGHDFWSHWTGIQKQAFVC